MQKKELIPSAAPVALSGRTVAEITADIQINYRNAKASIVQIGRDLAEVKTMLKHGEWLPYLQGLNISVSSAENYIRYSSEAAADDQIAALPYSAAMALIALPEPERQKVKEQDLEGKSAAEIKRLIAEVKAEKKRADDAEAKSTEATETADKLRRDLQAEREKPAQIVEREVAPPDYSDLKGEVARLRDQLTEAEDAAADAEERANEAVARAQRAAMQQLDEEEDEGPDGRPSLADFISICNDFQAKVWAVPFMGDVFGSIPREDLNSYRLFVNGVKSWADRVLSAMDEATAPLPAEGVVIVEDE